MNVEISVGRASEDIFALRNHRLAFIIERKRIAIEWKITNQLESFEDSKILILSSLTSFHSSLFSFSKIMDNRGEDTCSRSSDNRG